MRQTKYQTINLAQATSVTPVVKVANAEVDSMYKYVTGIAFIKKAGAGTNMFISTKDENVIVLAKCPVDFLELKGEDIEKDKLFLPVFIDGNGNSIDIVFEADTVTTAIDWDVILRLENTQENKPKIELQFQYKQFTIPNGTTALTKYQATAFDINSAYEKIIGMSVASSADIRIGLKEDNDDTIIDTMNHEVFKTTTAADYMCRWFKISAPARGQKVKFEGQPYATLVADLDIDVVLVLMREYK